MAKGFSASTASLTEPKTGRPRWVWPAFCKERQQPYTKFRRATERVAVWERGEVVTATSQLRFSGLQMACDMHRQTCDGTLLMLDVDDDASDSRYCRRQT